MYITIFALVSIFALAFAVRFVESNVSRRVAYISAILALLLNPILGGYVYESTLNNIRAIYSGVFLGLFLNSTKLKEFIKNRYSK
jgi:hypothetical protein